MYTCTCINLLLSPNVLQFVQSRRFIFQRYTLLMDCLDAEDRQRIKQAGSFRVKHVGGSVIRHSAIRAGHMYLTQSNFNKEVLQYADDLKESSV